VLKKVWTGFLVLAALSAPAVAEEIVLSSGEVLVANVIEDGADTLVVDHPILGVLPIPKGKVKSITSKPVEFDEEGASDAGAESAAAPAAADAAADVPEWKFAAEVGITGSSGNSDTLNVHVGVSGKKETKRYRWTMKAGWDKSRDDGETTKDQKFAQTQVDYFLEDSKFYPFVGARWDTDEFQDYAHRLRLDAGVGYKWITRETYQLEARAGAAALREFRGSDDSWRPEGLLGASVNWDITKKQNFGFETTWYPDLEDSGEYRWVTTAAWKVLLDEEHNLNLKIGVENEFDSHREDEFDDNDFRYYIALLFEF